MNTRELINEYKLYVKEYGRLGDIILFYTEYLSFTSVDLLDYFYDINNITDTELSLFTLKYSGKYFQIKHREINDPFTNYSYIGQLEWTQDNYWVFTQN